MEEEKVSLEEASAQCGLSSDEIERVCELGILPKEHLEFTKSDIRTLSALTCLKQMGLSVEDIAKLNLSSLLLAEISQYLADVKPASPNTCSTVLNGAKAVLHAHLNSLDMQIQQLNIQRESIQRQAQALDAILKALSSKSEES